MRFLYSFLLSLALCLPALASPERVEATALPRATMRELAARPAVETVRPRRKHRPVRLPAPIEAFSQEGQRTPATTATTIAAPPLATAFAGATSNKLYPADASGAVSRDYVVGAYNSGVVVQRRDGTQLVSLTLPQFWGHTSRPDGTFYDPRIAYDAKNDRWVMTALGGFHTVMLGVSATGDPAGFWWRYALEMDEEVDFTRLALTRDTVMVVTYYGEGLVLTQLLSTKKSELYAGQATIGLTRVVSSDQNLTPVSTEEAVEYVVTIGQRNVYVRPLTSNRYTSVRPNVNWEWVGDLAPQRDSAVPMDNGVVEPVSPVFVNGFIHGAQTVFMEGGRRSSIHWWKFRPDGTGLEWGLIDDPAGRKFYAFPSLAVNKNGAMLIGFSIFSADTHPSAAYVYRDGSGRISDVTPFRSGTSPWPFERWGDYTATVVDPVDGIDFWSVQLIAHNATWQSWWGRIDVPAGKRRSVGR